MEVHDLQQIFSRKSHIKKPLSVQENPGWQRSKKIPVEIDCYQREIEGRSTVGNFNRGQIGSMLEGIDGMLWNTGKDHH